MIVSGDEQSFTPPTAKVRSGSRPSACIACSAATRETQTARRLIVLMATGTAMMLTPSLHFAGAGKVHNRQNKGEQYEALRDLGRSHSHRRRGLRLGLGRRRRYVARQPVDVAAGPASGSG